MASDHIKIELLHASVDPDNQVESEFRILVDGRSFKYITIDPGLYEPDDMCFGPAFVSLLPPLPDKDWNVGHISLDPTTWKPHFATAAREELPGIMDIWQPVQIDILDLRVEQQLRSNVLEVTCDRFDSIVVAKFARFPWEIPQFESETTVYKWIDGHGVGPSFLGHLTEEGRVIGFVVAHIPSSRHPTPEDLTVCSHELSKVHQLGIKHGDINKHNFLIHEGNAMLIDFDNASRVASREVLEEELHSLEASLRDESGLGGVIEEEEVDIAQ